MKELTLSGAWWLPESPDKQTYGTLKFKPDNGMVLELIGSFKELEDMGQEVLKPPIILGFTTNGEWVTLYNCLESGSQVAFSSGIMSSTLTAQYLFIGCHFLKEEDIAFDEITLRFPYLEEWVGKSGFQSKFEYDEKGHFKKYDVSYSYPEKVEVTVNSFKVSINYSFEDDGMNRIKNSHLKQQTFIEIELGKRLLLNECLEGVISQIQNFLSFGIGTAIYPLEIKGRNKRLKVDMGDGRINFPEIYLYFSIKETKRSPNLSYRNMFFTFSDIERSFDKLLVNWFSKSSLLEPVFDLYFGTLYQPSMYLQNKFLSLAQALETYHRRVIGGSCVGDEEFKSIYEALKKALPENIPPDIKSNLVQKMRYLGSYTLKTRLEQILKNSEAYLEGIIADNAGFIDDVVNSRNYLTHFGEHLEGKNKTGLALYKLVQQLKFLIEICLLRELGLSVEEIHKLVKRNKAYEHIKTLQV